MNALFMQSSKQRLRFALQRRSRRSSPSTVGAALYAVAFVLRQGIPFSKQEILAHHLLDQITEPRARAPAEFAARLARIAEQRFNLGRTEVAWVDADVTAQGAAFEAARPRSVSTPISLAPLPRQVTRMPSSAAAAVTNWRTVRCSPVAMTKSSGLRCCSINHIAST